MIQEIFGRTRSPEFRGRVFILEDYDMRDRAVPRPGRRRLAEQPAPAARGVGHVGHEGRDERRRQPERPRRLVGRGLRRGDNGWAIGGREPLADEAAQDWADAMDLYRILEDEVVPEYYERDESGLPARWVERMRRSIATTLWQFSTTRMLHEYTERLYLPAAGIEVERGRAGAAEAEVPSMTAAHLARADAPQPPADRQLRLGLRGGLRAGLRADGRGARAPPEGPRRAALHGPAARVAARRAARRSSPTCGRSSSASQVEILGGGLYEPVLASLPERDRIGQLERGWPTRSRRRSGGGRAARGSRSGSGSRTCRRRSRRRATAGRSSTIRTSVPPRSPRTRCGARTPPTTRAGLISVFGTEQGLRYRIPFQEVDEVIDYLREHATEAGDRVGTMGDDGEKFGAWPTTWEHCWGKGRWVERFFEALEANADWLTTVRPSDWLAANAPIGRVYIPTGSYAEMGEWALPPDESREFAAALHHARDASAPEARWLRGAFWRNFQVKYREINDLHKQMLRASAKVEAMAPGPARDAALDHLYRGQSNDCYWHGLFGGIYIAHMRAATLAHLIAAEDLADAAAGPRRAAARCATSTSTAATRSALANDGPGRSSIDLDEGAGIGSWDLRAARHALTGVLRRRPEAYHETLRAHERRRPPTAGAPKPAPPARRPGGARRIDPRARPGQGSRPRRPPGLRRLRAPLRPRSGSCRPTRPPRPGAPAAAASSATSRPAPFRLVAPRRRRRRRRARRRRDDRRRGACPLRVETRVRARRRPAGPDRSSGRRRSRTAAIAPLDARIGIEWAITMLGGGGNPEAWWELGGRAHAPRRRGRAPRASIGSRRATAGSASSSRRRSSPAADAWYAPIETVSNSEAGFERVYQGSALLLSWPVRLAPGERWSATIRHRGDDRPSIAADRGARQLAARPRA